LFWTPTVDVFQNKIYHQDALNIRCSVHELSEPALLAISEWTSLWFLLNQSRKLRNFFFWFQTKYILHQRRFQVFFFFCRSRMFLQYLFKSQETSPGVFTAVSQLTRAARLPFWITYFQSSKTFPLTVNYQRWQLWSKSTQICSNPKTFDDIFKSVILVDLILFCQ
jgi:hypothetical protein